MKTETLEMTFPPSASEMVVTSGLEVDSEPGGSKVKV